MFAESLILAAAFEVLPFYQQKPDYAALRPLWSSEGETTDVLWPLFTAHRDWWRFCWFVHEQDYPEGGYQFDVLPIWWNGREKGVEAGERSDLYWGLFPIWGSHPHLLTLYDFEFCLWPVWMRYRMPRPKERRWMTTNAVLFPFFHWRDDGSWGFWPIYGNSHNRADDHWYALWPLWNWKTSFPDRDTGGAGTSWMFWPLFGRVDREREQQWLFLPPVFSWAETSSKLKLERGDSAPDMRLRCPWPIFEWESGLKRDRISVFPLWEHIVNRKYSDGAEDGRIMRFGWRLVELLPDETRVFPFWVSRPDDAYFRLWPFYESSRDADGVTHGRFLSLFPIRWVPGVDRNWAKFWTFYERNETPVDVRHSLLWSIIRWRTDVD